MPPDTKRIIVEPQLDLRAIPSVAEGVAEYAKARRVFIAKQRETGHWLAGNDNKVGAIAEFWMKLCYVIRGFKIDEIPVSNNAGWDFTATRNGVQRQVSVKAITNENKRGKQVQLVKGKIADPINWSSLKWEDFALITLDATLQPDQIAICPREAIQRVHEAGIMNAHRAVDRNWLATWMHNAGAEFPDVTALKSRATWTSDNGQD